MIIRHVALRGVRAFSSNPPKHTHLFLLGTSRLQPNSTRTTPRAHAAAARGFATSRPADEVMESLQEMYATAKDEFEMAAEETERKTVYAADDREAAKEALGALKDAYHKAVRESSPSVAQEVQARVGQRIRELENAVQAMEESAGED